MAQLVLVQAVVGWGAKVRRGAGWGVLGMGGSREDGAGGSREDGVLFWVARLSLPTR